jgi:deoxyribodipyrimidine photolyase-related protein
MVDPNDVYDWFISVISIDSYEWVMIPNIYGMIMYADGGFMMSRPYFSSSNYIKKMSNYGRGEEKKEEKGEKGEKGEKKKKEIYPPIKLKDGKEYKWDIIWDALYYNLINKHKNIFKKNYFLARNVYHWGKKSIKEKNEMLRVAKMYLIYLK